jgi:predicted ATPase
MLHLSRREAQVAQERAEATIALAREHGFAQWLAGGLFVQGWALVERGAVEEGITQLQQAQAAWRVMGTGLARTHIAVRLAEAYGKGGQAEAGLRELDEALNAVHDNAEYYRIYEAELYRLKGELLLQPLAGGGGARITPTEAEVCFQQALDVARHQRAKSLELRAVMSLSRLWQHQGRQAEAHGLLAATYGWFTEGFDTLDLQEAKALLAVLA